MVNKLPVGIMDSGIGGMTVAREISKLLPHESLIYLADQEMLPYGNKSANQICLRMQALCAWMQQRYHIKALVIACNTATAAAAHTLRSRLPIPVIGMEPAVKPAARVTRNRRIGILATEGTLKSARFAGLLKTFAQGLHVSTQPCPGLVEAIETGHLSQIESLLRQYIQPLQHRQVDTIVLGCTHYPLVRDLIAKIAGDDIRLIDTGQAVAQHTAHLLMQHNLLHPLTGTGTLTVATTASANSLQSLLPRLFPDMAINRVTSLQPDPPPRP